MDIKEIQGIIKDFEKSTITSLEIEMENFKIKLNKSDNNQVQEVKKQPVRQLVVEEVVSEPVRNGYEVKSPLVGTYYAAKSPKDQPFAKVGQKVEKGQTLCIIEAMKIMNEITASIDGTIDQILIKNGEPVGFDQVIMTII